MIDKTKLSQLPDDDAYWADLETRIVASLGQPPDADFATARDERDVVPGFGVVRSGPFDDVSVRSRGVDPWAPLTAHAYELAAFAVAAAAAVALLVPSPATVAATAATNMAGGLLTPPSDEMALMASLTAEAPPALGQLVLPVTVNEEEESR
jgi:hypothetical protein